ncbi:MAG TPA: hypothetical protein VL098_01650 [Flavipsychrobacter sp.]|nr:hypothetical protein [Flavipsychrobacter sp.]
MNLLQRPKAALIELYDSHDVNLYSQLAFLKHGGYDTTLIVSKHQRQQVSHYNLEERIFFTSCTGKKGLLLLLELRRIRNLIVKEKFDVVIFNTAHGSTIRTLCLMHFPESIRFAGTLHGVNKLAGSGTQKMISSRVRKYFLLSFYMREKAMKMPHGDLKFEVFYPMFHPRFHDVEIHKKEAGALWIGVPGAVEYKRRDYETLLHHFAALKEKPNLKFVILGNGNHAEGNGAQVQQTVKELGIADHFIFFNKFVTNDLFHKYVQACDAILPLIHPINADMEKYLENQISGSFHLAYSYKLPLLMHDFFSRYKEDFKDNSIFYSLENMGEMLAALPVTLINKERDFYTEDKWTFEYQAERYLSFLR